MDLRAYETTEQRINGDKEFWNWESTELLGNESKDLWSYRII